MMRYIAPGMLMRQDFGTIAKCPHCEEINITMRTRNQVTCGKIPCQAAQNALMGRLNARRIAAKKRRSAA